MELILMPMSYQRGSPRVISLSSRFIVMEAVPTPPCCLSDSLGTGIVKAPFR
jgi:hypothetical protein